MKISVWCGDLSDKYLKQVVQLGADHIDFGNGDAFPGVKEQGYPNLDELLKIKRKIRSWGLNINRVTCLNPDHIPRLEGDGPNTSLGLAYSIGYIKALLAAMAVLP